MITVTLPLPPSANALFVNAPGRGRFKSAAYKSWLTEAGWCVQTPTRYATVRRVAGPYTLTITVPATMRGDIDNRVKAISDLLVKHGITDDDRAADAVTVRRGATPSAQQCIVEIAPARDVAA